MALSAFAVTAPGLAPLAAAELGALGVTQTETERAGVGFPASEAALVAALLHLRTATRVIVRAAEFRATSFAQLQQRAKAVPWATWVRAGGRVRFRVTCRKSRLYHSDAVAERLAGAVMGAVRGATVVAGAMDDDDGDDDAQLFIVRLADDTCTISADAAGVSLHKRGYRQAVSKAPLRETLAAAMLLGPAWDGSVALCDPMCGSGTIPIEAALIARRIAPGLRRTFAAERWPSADAAVWREARAAASAAVRAGVDVPIAGSDRDDGAIAAARANAERAGVAQDIAFAHAPISAARAPAARGLLVTNPPYGIRVGESAAIRDLYATFGRIARTHFAGWRCALLSADRTRGHTLERQLGLDLREVWRSSNGGIAVRLVVAEADARAKTR